MKRSGRTSSTSECDHLHTSAPADKRCKPNNNEPDTSSAAIIGEQLNVDFVRRNFTTNEIVGDAENHTSSLVTEEFVQRNPSKSPHASEETVDVKPVIKIEIKSEPEESLVATAASSVSSKQIVIKTEPDDHSAASAAPPVLPTSEVIKAEPVSTSIADATISTSTAIATAIALPTTAAPTAGTNSPQRASCNYGIRCFRRNPQHRNDMAHPGDPDYRRPDFPPAPPGMPACPFGASCYRRNPQHFVQFNHPPICK